MPKRALAICSLVLWACPAWAVTAYYQPTPATESFVDAYYPPLVSPAENLAASHTWQGWVSAGHRSTFARDDTLWVGGSRRDQCRSYLRFDLAGLPKRVDRAELVLSAFASSASLSAVDIAICRVTGAWVPTMSWKAQPSYTDCSAWQQVIPGLSESLAITDWYNAWQEGSLENDGVVLVARSLKKGLDAFRSSRYELDTERPLLALTYTPPSDMPYFALPLDRGYWLLSNEIGGYECLGQAPWPDTAHQGSRYFSLDFLPVGRHESGAPYTGDALVFPAASGEVVETGYSAGNGYYAVVNHSGSLDPRVGYTSKYLHLAGPVTYPIGTHLYRDSILGTMGNSGDYTTGTHLHFGVYYNGQGGADVEELSYLLLDGLLMKSYQTECSYDSSGSPTTWIRSYHSSNGFKNYGGGEF